MFFCIHESISQCYAFEEWLGHWNSLSVLLQVLKGETRDRIHLRKLVGESPADPRGPCELCCWTLTGGGLLTSVGLHITLGGG